MGDSHALNSPYSRLYSILKAGLSNTNGSVNKEDILEPEPLAKRPREESESMDDQHWRCWQCPYVAGSEHDLAEHIRNCKPTSNDAVLPGCPYCELDGCQSSTSPFEPEAFTVHMEEAHQDVPALFCCYCLAYTESPRLEDLVKHIASEHKIHWCPSPASMAYLRRTQLPHRVVTCLGCGWCTFVLRANNSAQPPVSLELHLQHCPSTGGRVHLENITHGMCASVATQKQLVSEAEELDRLFSEAYPLVRAAPVGTAKSPVKETHLHYRTKFVGRKQETTFQACILPSKPSSQISTPSKSKGNKQRPNSLDTTPPQPLNGHTTNKGPSFDVPLTLPPLPSVLAKSGAKSSAPTLLYVCPLCGDNALASLRERDEHLQSSHNGELVFPCQICGLAYPLYIALRRHAALKHDSNYDLVRYGPPELVETEPIECPECHLVAFTDRNVLKLHLYEMHKILPDRAKSLIRTSLRKAQTAALARDGGSGRRGGRGGKRDSKGSARDRTMANRGEKPNSKSVSLSRLERLLGDVSGDPAPSTCRLCRTPLDNAKEFRLHMELDHVDVEEECEQLGCQACGRIFFGSGGRIDLIGHLRVLHQDTDQSSALSCPQAEQKSIEKVTEDGKTVHVKPCEALFSSPRLRHIHSNTCATKNPGFACPLSIELPDAENMDVADLSEQIRAAIMETECAADREGLMILAYCCPNCSRLFAGHEAPTRYAAHRQMCQADGTAAEKPQSATEPKPAGATTVLESMLRQGSDIRIN
ncbi:hypothetical protein CSKR_109897 [Clonorchis sinensis]|uniref:Uncharacterized protein n=2 Tax=Clonorchis sinensis TaxID=79923 RepID=H2KNV5_CLOSI|nr:hypothetical protein CSKR_109897 [Clonorchis sinensis]GAA38314.1 hypothetical protein CLF_100837 [Clonorchis sinensis]